MVKRFQQLALSVVFVSVLLLGASAEAKDVAGRFGLGLDNTLTAATLGIGDIPSTPNSMNAPKFGMSFKYWITNDWGIAGVLGVAYASDSATEGVYDDDQGFWAFALDVKGIYNFAKGEDANMGVFLNLHMRKESTTLRRPEGAYNSNLGFAVSAGFTPEVFLTENFAFVAEFGLTMRLQNGFAAGISGDNFLGGLGFHYYF